MSQSSPRRITAVFQALLVTFLWSTSFIIIKLGLKEIPALTFAGLRYVLAFVILLPFIFRRQQMEEIKRLNLRDWGELTLLGLAFYTFTQGAQFAGLQLLPAVTVSLILNFTPGVVAILGIFLLKEIPSRIQWGGMILFIAGIIIYFCPTDLSGNLRMGIALMVFGLFANAFSAIIGRGINRKGNISPLTITLISMGIGSLILLAAGISIQGLPKLSGRMWLYIFWLSALNTAFAFTLWNRTLRTLLALESSIINGTMLFQIAVLAWIFLGESVTLKEGVGILTAAAGVIIVQLRRSAAVRK